VNNLESNKEQDETLYELARLIAAYSNPQVHFDLKGSTMEERQIELEALKKLMGEILG